jgi:hypothetical protein
MIEEKVRRRRLSSPYLNPAGCLEPTGPMLEKL